MRGHKSRLVAAVVLAGLCASVVGWSDRFVRGQPVAPPGVPVPGKAKDKDKKEDTRPARDADIPFGFPYERDTKQKLQAARDYLTQNEIPWNTVCSVAQYILDTRSDSFFDVEYKAGDTLQINRISVKTEANRIIAAFPKAGLEFYQQQYGQAAVLMLETAVGNNYDLAALSEVSQRYFHTRAGAEATVLLASIYLERGNYLESAYAFERLLGRPDADEFLTPRVVFKASLALKRSGDPRHATLFKDVSARLAKETTRNGLLIGRKLYTAEQVQAELDRQVSAVKTVSTVGEWAMRYGNPSRNAISEGGPPFLVPAFKPTGLIEARRDEDKTANTWLTEELDRLFDRENRNIRSLPLPGFFPVTTPDLVLFRGYDGVYAVATRDHVHRGELVRAGATRWISKTHVGVHQMMTPANANYYDPRSREEALAWWNTYKGNGSVASVLFENPLIGTLAHDGQNVYFTDDLAIPPPPPMRLNDFGGMPNQQARHSGDLADANRAGELVAVEIASGNRVWSLGRVESKYIKGPILPRLSEEDADKSTSAFHLCMDAIFLGPPLPLNGRLYVLIEQAGVVRLLCLDPRTLVQVKDWPQQVPTLVWSQKLGRPVNSLPDDSIRRYQGAFLAAGEGIIVCPTNSGALVAVDIMSRSLLWAHAYRRTDQNSPGRPAINPNTGQYMLPTLLPTDRWRAAAPIISGGRVIVTAYDSNKLECIDLRSGKLLWTTPRESTDLYVGGVVNDKVVVVGKTGVRAYQVRGENATNLEPKLAWNTPITVTPTGHGVAGKGVFYLPVRQESAGKDNIPAAELWAFNVETGEIPSKTAARKRSVADGSGPDLARYGLGNLVFQDGLVVAQSAVEVACYPQLDLKEAEMNRKLAANPKDPEGLTARGEILLDKGQLKEAIADFNEAKKNKPDEALSQNLREKLYTAYTELIRTEVQRNNFAAVEPVLGEYASLCEVPLDGTTDPFEKKKREDETLRRKRMQLYLLARGRESQNRLVEAFDQYLALANLGEAKTLFEMPDEPSVKMRPDVWARGRIERMISKAPDPAARKSLEDRVLGEWKKIENGNDLPRLREFVAVFGPYFPVGSLAELKLSEKLLETNNDDDARDAQTHLSALRAAAADPLVRAQATEALARLMTRSGLLEDAVGLYLQLGKDYPKVVVRDGKTGEDYLTDLLTDRRLLPYLEPSRYPFPSRVKAEQKPGTRDGQMGAIFEVDPEGELFPMFRRLRFVFDLNAAGNGQWTLRAIDRTTGADRCRFGNLTQPQINNINPGQWMSAKFVHASGHLLLVQLGPMVYCLDLAEKKELWSKNLLGDGAANPKPNVGMNTELTPEGDFVIRYDEGYMVTLGKSATIQPGYVCLATRDGLEVSEPVSRKPLWTRRNVSGRLQVYGDARHILLIEMSDTRPTRPVKTTLLRAVDGVVVETAPDAGRVLAEAKTTYRILGRTALITQGTADQPRVVRLYDFATGTDLWRRESDAKSIPLRSFTNDWAGFVKPTGEVEVFSVRDGKPAGKFQIDAANVAAHLGGCAEAQLFADPERFYVVLDKDANARQQVYWGVSLRTQKVNGPMYCFDRASGARKWFFEDVLDKQSLVVEQFADLPVIVAAAPIPQGNNGWPYRVVVIEKDRGRLLFNNTMGQGSNFFQNMTVDPKNGTIDLHRYDVRLHISPDDGKPAGGK